MDIKLLAKKIETAQTILDEIRRESGCGSFRDAQFELVRRQETALETAVRVYADRRERSKHFEREQIFGEPAWDMLLDLYIHQARNEKVSVKSALIGSGASASTAMRWLGVLDAEGLIRSEDDPADSARRLVRLTPEGYEGITRYLEQIARHVWQDTSPSG